MKRVASSKNKISLATGTLVLGDGKVAGVDSAEFQMVFRCRKEGIDFLGQLKIPERGSAVGIEMFNENYFSMFSAAREAVVGSLVKAVLARLIARKKAPSPFESIAREQLEGLADDEAPLLACGPGEIDLQEIFVRLNREYFENKIQARVQWAREIKGRNRRSLRFGSYDSANKIVRIHPRLKRDFVPRCVVELTLYHEMCHQWAPSIRQNGQWIAHHPAFKRKEREYRFYRESREWERRNWRKLLAPASETTDKASR